MQYHSHHALARRQTGGGHRRTVNRCTANRRTVNRRTAIRDPRAEAEAAPSYVVSDVTDGAGACVDMRSRKGSSSCGTTFVDSSTRLASRGGAAAGTRRDRRGRRSRRGD